VTIKPIRSDADLEVALARARELIRKSDPKSKDELEVLQALIERWERTNHAIPAATPAEAIRFRMSQSGMRPRDLEPYLGAKSRVSEIINGQRQPTVDQIRALNQHLGIPVESLIGLTKLEAVSRPSGALIAAENELKRLGVMKPTDALPSFVARAARVVPSIALLRKTRTERTNAKTDFGALEAWCAAVLQKADKLRVSKQSLKNAAQARALAKLSARSDWHTKLTGWLADVGVAFVTLDHLPGTFLDGAAIRLEDGTPVIALTLRHDRLDNFWFTLLHEFAHVSLHLSLDTPLILDDLDVRSTDGIEAEADAFARDALIPSSIWTSRSSPDMSIGDVEKLARDAGIHPAIAAGRWRYEYGDYRRFSRLIGRNKVRPLLKT
jgi:HTH-type transcriptional regulator / antitoxin HigA